MQIFGITWKWNIPNALSVLRMALIPVFAVLYLYHLDMWAFGVLLLSGITDLLDGVIARRFHQITDCGKLLDPLSDKLTQVAVIICLATRYQNLLYLMIVCLVKEGCQAIGGILLLRRRTEVRASKWFGKASTVVFYACMLAMVLWYDVMTPQTAWILIGVAGVTMLAAFLGYLRIFLSICRANKQETNGISASVSPEKG